MENYPLVLNIIMALGAIVFAAGYFIERYRASKKQADRDIRQEFIQEIKDLSDRLAAQKDITDSYKQQVERFQEQLIALTAEVNKLKGLNEANDKKIQEYYQIITDRNPNVEKTLDTIISVMDQVTPFMEEMKKSHQFLREELTRIVDPSKTSTLTTL